MVKKVRQSFADLMLELAKKDKKLVVVVGDISHGILKPFAAYCPDRYYNIGICEPSTVNLAAGLSKSGLNPVVHTITPFITERSYEQIKLDFGYQKLDVNIITVGGAFDYSKLGCSHHCYSDVSLFMHFNRAKVFLPGSNNEFNYLFKNNYKKSGIKYFRLPEYSNNLSLKKSQMNNAVRLASGKDLTIVTTGQQVNNALKAVNLLKKNNIYSDLIYYHTLKPFDKKTLINSIKKTRKMISIEELSHHGGLYSECINNIVGINNLKTIQMAIKDFVHGYGSYEDLCNRAGLNVNNIVKNAKKILKS